MAINAKCPHCLSRYTFADEQAGLPVPCTNPACMKVFKCPRLPVPAPAAVGAVAPAVAPPKPLAPTPLPQRPPAPPRPPRPDPSQAAAPTPPTGNPTPAATPKLPAPKKEPVAERAKRPDAESVASQAFADEPPPEDPNAGVPGQTIRMKCEACDHGWDVPWDKQGKNVVCPECGHRQRVPEQKSKGPGGWREKSTLPSLAKQNFEVPKDVADNKATVVSTDSLRKGGALGSEFESVPKWYYGVAAGVIFAIAGVVVLSVSSNRHTNDLARRDAIMGKAMEAFAEPASEVPEPERPLFRAALHLAAAEYFAAFALKENLTEDMLGKPGGRDPGDQGARAHLQQARSELKSAPKSLERDLLFAELAVAQIALGGTDQQVLDGVRLGWNPVPVAANRPAAQKTFSVLEELRQTQSAMADRSRPVDLDVRLATVRRAARELAKQRRTAVIESVVHTMFLSPDEDFHVPEAKALIGIEAFRAGDKDAAAKTLDGLKAVAPVPVGAKVLAKLLGVADEKLAMPPEPGANGPVGSESTRTAYVMLWASDGKTDDAVKLAERPGGPSLRKLQLLSLIAEWATDPKLAVDAAVKWVPSDP
ncbi:MAG: hypothetical protein ACRC7O_14235, partial [Fimbriiglobus sp.]